MNVTTGAGSGYTGDARPIAAVAEFDSAAWDALAGVRRD
jgi:hypothetical protein